MGLMFVQRKRLETRARFLTAVIALGLVGDASAESTDAHWYVPSYELGVVSSAIPLGAGIDAQGTGIRLTEQSGWITMFTVGAPVAALMYMTVQDQEVVGVRKVYAGSDGITKTTECSGEGSGRRCSEVTYRSERRLVDIQVDTKPLPPEVVAEQYRVRNAALEKLFLRPMHFDITYFPNRDDGSIHGGRATWYPVSLQLGPLLQVAVGYNYTRLTADVEMSGTTVSRTVRAHAIPVRLVIKPTLWMYATAEVSPNLLGLGESRMGENRSSSARADLTLKVPRSVPILHRLYGRTGVERRGLASGGTWGLHIEAGLSF